MDKIVGKTFRGVEVDLEAAEFEGCTFDQVILQYAGGPLIMSNCRIRNSAWQFTGDFANGLHTLGQLFASQPDDLMAILRQSIFAEHTETWIE